MPLASSCHPHSPDHDYYAPGICLVTLVVRDREPLLCILNTDSRHPTVRKEFQKIKNNLGKKIENPKKRK
jgi:hypothetical protein